MSEVSRSVTVLSTPSQAAIDTGKQGLDQATKALEDDRSDIRALQQAATERESAAASREATAAVAVQEAEMKSAEAAAAVARSADKEAELQTMHDDVWAKVRETSTFHHRDYQMNIFNMPAILDTCVSPMPPTSRGC